MVQQFARDSLLELSWLFELAIEKKSTSCERYNGAEGHASLQDAFLVADEPAGCQRH